MKNKIRQTRFCCKFHSKQIDGSALGIETSQRRKTVFRSHIIKKIPAAPREPRAIQCVMDRFGPPLNFLAVPIQKNRGYSTPTNSIQRGALRRFLAISRVPFATNADERFSSMNCTGPGHSTDFHGDGKRDSLKKTICHAPERI